MHGPIPDDVWVLHRCDNPPCINVDHLFLGNHATNMADKRAKNTKHAEIRSRLAAGETPNSLAPEYGVSSRWIRKIRQDLHHSEVVRGNQPTTSNQGTKEP